MPTYVFTCKKGHSEEVYRKVPYKVIKRKRCVTCALWAYRDYMKEHAPQKAIYLNYEDDPISHLSKKRSFKGITIENLTPEPVRIKSHAQYMKLLKDTHSIEKRANK